MKTLLLAGVALLFAGPAFGQTAPNPDSIAADDQGGTASGARSGGEIVVTAPIQQSERDVLSGTSILTGDQLARDLRPTIGETLSRQPGVSSTAFGPNASRPVLRGFQGERIRVLTDGIGSIDVSNTSVDHAVAINPLLAERVEVLRGPAALLFGSSAVGGVVNVVDTRIPRTVPEDGYRIAGNLSYGSAANERSASAAGDVAVGRMLVLHADGSYVKTDDLRIGGDVLSRQARNVALASAAAAPADPLDFGALANLRDRLPNSASETWTAGLGASIVTDGGSLGLAYSHYDSFYGIPSRYTLTPGGEAPEAPRLDIVQNRFDLRGEIAAGGSVIDRIRVRAGFANYRHFELEPDGEIGTAFYNKGIEARAEIVQARRGAWLGASGVQVFNREFDVEGDEAFLPRSATTQVGLFTLQQLDLGKLKAEAGLRYENTSVASRVVADDLRFPLADRKFDAISGSLGASYGFARDWRFGVNVSRTERAPAAEELLANGPHAGTEAYELGNPDFGLETSWGVEATLHGHGQGYSLDASAYYNWISNYIYDSQVAQDVCVAAASPSGRDVDLPCFQYRQADARYYGIEARGSLTLATIGTYKLNADLLGDWVHATIVDQRAVPRIPPVRLLGGIEVQSDRLTARAEVEHAFRQSRVAAFETTTDAFTLVNAALQLKPFAASPRTTLTLSANNIFDVDARRAASVLKDFAPLAGRDLRATLGFAL